jgi:hypothetical protein
VTSQITRSGLLLSAQRALLGAVPFSLRGASIETEGDTIFWRCVFDREPTDEEREALSVAGTEIMADFPQVKKIEEQFLVQSNPGKVSHLRNIVFERSEVK